MQSRTCLQFSQNIHESLEPHPWLHALTDPELKHFKFWSRSQKTGLIFHLPSLHIKSMDFQKLILGVRKCEEMKIKFFFNVLELLSWLQIGIFSQQYGTVPYIARNYNSNCESLSALYAKYVDGFWMKFIRTGWLVTFRFQGLKLHWFIPNADFLIPILDYTYIQFIQFIFPFSISSNFYLDIIIQCL